MTRLLSWLRANPLEVAMTLAFLAVAVGCWLVSPALGLIVPGSVVFLALAWLRITGGG